MLVKTKFKDVPFSEVMSHYDFQFHNPEFEKIWETRFRGKEVVIVTPHIGIHERIKIPYYALATEFIFKGINIGACSVCAEIGD